MNAAAWSDSFVHLYLYRLLQEGDLLEEREGMRA